ncbi:unnamed protein product, partial [Polarella glacialis]
VGLHSPAGGHALIEVVTVSDDEARAQPLLHSCPFLVRHLLVEQPWKPRRKFEKLIQYLDDGLDASDEHLVLVLDAFDVRCLGGHGSRESEHETSMLAVIDRIVRGFGKPLFFGAEFGFDPWGP